MLPTLTSLVHPPSPSSGQHHHNINNTAAAPQVAPDQEEALGLLMSQLQRLSVSYTPCAATAQMLVELRNEVGAGTGCGWDEGLGVRVGRGAGGPRCSDGWRS